MVLLTVIVPFYDEILYLRNALNSILAQGIKALQIIVVNDNPECFSARDMAALGASGAVELVQHPRNLGLSAARNSGLRQARGRFVGFLDSDDYYTLGGLEHQLSRARDTGADITHAQTWFTHLGSTEARILPRDAAFFAKPRSANGLIHAEEAQFITSSWSSLYGRAFLRRNDLWFDEAQPRFEDRLFVLHTVTRAASITFTGCPTRVWRGRAGSISVTTATSDTHRLQVQLLEKCLAHIRTEVDAGRLRPWFEKRELFNTVSRLIWDMDVIDAINRDDDPAYADLAARIVKLLGDNSFGHAIFDDKVLGPVSRVGMPTRKGRINRERFFAIHRAMRAGEFGETAALIRAASPQPTVRKARRANRAKRARRLVLHLGLHKTGTTYLQHHLITHQKALLQKGILVPLTGFHRPDSPVRDGATPGHQGLVASLRVEDKAIWQSLDREIRDSGAHTVVISCENMLFPTLSDRDVLISRLCGHLRGYDQVDLIVLARRADTYVESLYREKISHGTRISPQGIAGYVADHAQGLTNLPGLLGLFEERLGSRARLGDFDMMIADNGLWPGFCALAGLPGNLPILDVARYRTPDRHSIQILHFLNALVADPELRRQILTAWFRLHPKPGEDSSLLSPEARAQLLDSWQAQSAGFAADRGYCPDLSTARASLAKENWTPPDMIPANQLQELISIANQATQPLFSTSTPHADRSNPQSTRPARGDMLLTIRLRPWAANLVRRLQRGVR